MKQTLQLKLSQHLTLTPQLQQSIRLLQLSTIELNAEVERMLQENPLLEREETDETHARRGAARRARPRPNPGDAARTSENGNGSDERGDSAPARRRHAGRSPTSRTMAAAATATGAAARGTTTTTSSRSRSRPARCATT